MSDVEPYTPYDQPAGLLDRLLFPMLRRAWLQGFRAGQRAYPRAGSRRTYPNE